MDHQPQGRMVGMATGHDSRTHHGRDLPPHHAKLHDLRHRNLERTSHKINPLPLLARKLVGNRNLHRNHRHKNSRLRQKQKNNTQNSHQNQKSTQNRQLPRTLGNHSQLRQKQSNLQHHQNTIPTTPPNLRTHQTQSHQRQPNQHGLRRPQRLHRRKQQQRHHPSPQTSLIRKPSQSLPQHLLLRQSPRQHTSTRLPQKQKLAPIQPAPRHRHRTLHHPRLGLPQRTTRPQKESQPHSHRIPRRLNPRTLPRSKMVRRQEKRPRHLLRPTPKQQTHLGLLLRLDRKTNRQTQPRNTPPRQHTQRPTHPQNKTTSNRQLPTKRLGQIQLPLHRTTPLVLHNTPTHHNHHPNRILVLGTPQPNKRKNDMKTCKDCTYCHKDHKTNKHRCFSNPPTIIPLNGTTSARPETNPDDPKCSKYKEKHARTLSRESSSLG